MTDLTLDDLDRLYRPASPLVNNKVLDHVERHGRRFIELSPFCVIGACDAAGAMDVSPRGGEPGFIHVSDDGRTLFVPDRPGNNRLDTLRNLLTGSGRIGMMFVIPGVDDIFRVNGRATLSDDAGLLADFVEFGRLPRLVIRIAVEEAFLHCPKALMRGRLWDAEAQIDRDRLPSGAEMVFDQLNLGKVPVSNEVILADYKTQL